MEILEKLLENGATVDFQDRVRGQILGGRWEVDLVCRVLFPVKSVSMG